MPSTTTNTPETISFDGRTFSGAGRSQAFDPESRVAQALADRLRGLTWREVAMTHGYRSANVAEHNVGRYVAWLNGRTESRRTTAAARPMSLRRYGVEIEFVGCTMAAAARAMSTALGYEVRTNGYHSPGYGAWKVERDGSVTDYRDFGGEAVSPVLSGQDGLNQIKLVMDAIRSVGGRVSVRTGLHVHIDATDLNGEQIARLLGAYVDRQDAFDRMVSPSRRYGGRSHYCGRYSEAEKVQVQTELKAYRSARANRYRTVNVNSLGRTGTVEFRQHQGTLNARKIGAWINLLLALTESVIATQDEHLPTGAPELIEALTGFGMTDRDARHLTGRLA